MCVYVAPFSGLPASSFTHCQTSEAVNGYHYTDPSPKDVSFKVAIFIWYKMPSPFRCQERDGCVNVLKSYQLDAGVDALLKENLTEVRMV